MFQAAPNSNCGSTLQTMFFGGETNLQPCSKPNNDFGNPCFITVCYKLTIRSLRSSRDCNPKIFLLKNMFFCENPTVASLKFDHPTEKTQVSQRKGRSPSGMSSILRIQKNTSIKGLVSCPTLPADSFMQNRKQEKLTQVNLDHEYCKGEHSRILYNKLKTLNI